MHRPSALPEGTVLLHTAFCTVGVDPAVGNLPALTFHWQGKSYAPLHRAPWVEDTAFRDGMPLVDQRLSGDFVCAPFGLNDVEPAPLHGWSANSAWTHIDSAPDRLCFQLDRKIMGASLTKTVIPSTSAPLLYQDHLIKGGDGGLTFAHHPMIRVKGGAKLFTSPKQFLLTAQTPIVEGRHALALDALCEDLHSVPATQGGTLDLSHLPISEGDEDFVALAEAPGSKLGWTAVIRADENDIIFVLKDPQILPLTMLWHSNGGRKDAPWSGRHRGVLGIEDGIAAGGAGHAAALGDSVFTQHGIATALPLGPGRTHRIAHVIGAVPCPPGWDKLADITLDGACLTLHGPGDARLALAFEDGFF